MMPSFYILFSLFLCTLTLVNAKTKVACVGDSITFGAGIKERVKNCYPAQLAALLGDDYEVKNFGVNGATMLQQGNKPYLKQGAYKRALSFQPDVVIIKLGTNDSKPQNWEHKDHFQESANKLIRSFQALETKPRIILCKPAPVVEDRWGINEKITRGEVAKQIETIAFKNKLELVDLHITLRDKPEFIPDKVHPNAQGAERIAKHLHRVLTIPRSSSTKTINQKVETSSHFYGYNMVTGSTPISFKIVSPLTPAKGKPWIWRARFWGHQPQFDIQMLELGYHIVYCDVADLFGSPEAVKRWDSFYIITQEWGLHPKPVLEGMSRGGLIIHNWALSNPDKVAGIIGDNCVMDIKSWPAGFSKGAGSPGAWETCKNAYGLKSDAEAKTFLQNPIDRLENIQKANIPLLYLISTGDKIVPAAENSGLAAEQLKTYPQLKVITKPGKGHHPHSLPNPAPITEFALKCYGFSVN